MNGKWIFEILNFFWTIFKFFRFLHFKALAIFEIKFQPFSRIFPNCNTEFRQYYRLRKA